MGEEKMGLDYYKILHVDKDASIDDLYEAFSKLYTKWDPEKYPDNKKEVLTDPQKRSVCDQYGEEGLKKGESPTPGADGPGGSTTYFSTGEGPTTYRSNPRAHFGSRGGSSPHAFRFNPRYSDHDPFNFSFFSLDSGGIWDGGCKRRHNSCFGGGLFDDNIFTSFGGGGGSSPGVSMHQRYNIKAPPVNVNLACTLEELYKGITKKLMISREIISNTGKKKTVEETVTFDVKPGWKKGTRITFPGRGNEVPGVEPADVVFIIDEKPHKLLTRDGNDLVVTQKVSQAEASSGYEVRLTTLDGRNLTIPFNYVIRPTSKVLVIGEGMPLPKDPSKRGNLRIRFDVKD